MKRYRKIKVLLSLIALIALPTPSWAERLPEMANLGDDMKKDGGACDINQGGICGLPSDEESLRKLLSPEQYRIIRENGTERPFENEYWNNHRAGIYVDRVSGQPLFSSTDKFDSGSGWPSFSKPLDPNSIIEKSDSSHGMQRTEVRSKQADSHLGHIFNDGPPPTRIRYCINSASLKFIPFEDLDKAGLGNYKERFVTKK